MAAQAEDEDDVGASLVGAEADGEGAPKGCLYAATEPADELRYNELVLLLEDEMASVEEEFEYEEKLNEERAAIERDACLAPAGEEWRMMLRREESLDRAIDRKIKLLLSLRKAAARTQRSQTLESRSAPAELGAPAEDVGAPLEGAQARRRVRPRERTALSRGERVSGSGAVISRSVTGEGFFPHPEPKRLLTAPRMRREGEATPEFRPR